MGYGWRGRIGLIVPSTNSTMESEFHRLAPEGVSLHVARMLVEEGTKYGRWDEVLGQMYKASGKAAEEVSTVDVDVVVFGCTAGSFFGGVDYERSLAEKLSETAKVPAVTTSGSVAEALKTLKAEKLVLASPYPEDLNQKEKVFLESFGFNILRMKGLGILSNVECGWLTPDTTYKLTREAFVPEADTVFISCTNLRTIDVIQALEHDLAHPVVSSNTAAMWAALKTIGIKEKIRGFGSLLENHL